MLGALQGTALAYLRRDAASTVAFWRMASAPLDGLRRAPTALGVGDPVDCASVPGGGSAPGLTIPSAGVALDGDHTATLRAAALPVIARVEDDRTVCDLRTVDARDDDALAAALRVASSAAGP